MKIFLEEDRPEGRGRKVMYSTSLPETLNQSLDSAATALHRKKADWIRTALILFTALSEKEQEQQILKTYNEVGKSRPRPFTTTLFQGQLGQLDALSKSLQRSKAEILRAAIFHFQARTPADQEKLIKKTLSR
ncbi:MAG: hypothetical protein AB1585_03755 [Thermodesulfobacteriota bacterium]